MSQAGINLHYHVSMPQSAKHLFKITLEIQNWLEKTLTLKMPVWTPGSYLVREYSRHIQTFSAISAQKKNQLNYQKVSKNEWLIDTNKETDIVIGYEVYANDLTVRTNHLDATHGFFTGAALFFYIPLLKNLPFQITIEPPSPDWKIITALPPVSERNNSFLAPDFDTLVDSPFEIGINQQYDFEVENKPHKWVIWGEGKWDVDKIIADTKKIIKTESQMFGGLPYDDYFFLLHLSAGGFGGLEHKNCCVLNYSRFEFNNPEKYNRFMQLVAHEFFHLWNVKRIRPKELEIFDYDRENYTTCLWFCEGSTSYYDMILPLRAGIYDREYFLNLLSKDISQYLNIGGRKVQPLAESSFDAWIKLYRRDAYSNNCQISYYLKGELVSLLLDLIIRNNSKNQKSYDDVMRAMWHKFGKEEIGFYAEELIKEIELVANLDLTEFFHLYLDTTAELPFNQYFEPFGLILQAKSEESTIPYLGITAKQQQITFVDANSPAGESGIDAGDELLALDNFKVTEETLPQRLKNYQAGDVVQLSVFHQEELKTVSVKLASPQASAYEVKIKDNITSEQKENLDQWLKVMK